MHLDSHSARSHAAELAALRAALREQAAAAARRTVEVQADTRTAAPRLIARLQTRPFPPAAAGYAASFGAGRQPPLRSTSTTDRVLPVRRPADDWPAPTRVPRVTA